MTKEEQRKNFQEARTRLLEKVARAALQLWRHQQEANTDTPEHRAYWRGVIRADKDVLDMETEHLDVMEKILKKSVDKNPADMID